MQWDENSTQSAPSFLRCLDGVEILNSFFYIPETFKTLAKSFGRTVHWEPFTLLIFITCSINYFPIYRISINREAHIVVFIITAHSNPILVRG